ADQLAAEFARMGAHQAAQLIEELPESQAIDILQRVNPAVAGHILAELSDEHRAKLFLNGPAALTRQWTLNQTFPDDTIGRLMEPPTAVFRPSDTVGDVSNRVKELVKKIFVTYCFVTDETGKLVGIVTMRDLLVSEDSSRLSD